MLLTRKFTSKIVRPIRQYSTVLDVRSGSITLPIPPVLKKKVKGNLVEFRKTLDFETHSCSDLGVFRKSIFTHNRIVNNDRLLGFVHIHLPGWLTNPSQKRPHIIAWSTVWLQPGYLNCRWRWLDRTTIDGFWTIPSTESHSKRIISQHSLFGRNFANSTARRD